MFWPSQVVQDFFHQHYPWKTYRTKFPVWMPYMVPVSRRFCLKNWHPDLEGAKVVYDFFKATCMATVAVFAGFPVEQRLFSRISPENRPKRPERKGLSLNSESHHFSSGGRVSFREGNSPNSTNGGRTGGLGVQYMYLSWIIVNKQVNLEGRISAAANRRKAHMIE